MPRGEARRGGARAATAARARRPSRGRRAPPARGRRRRWTAALTSTIRPPWSIVITASSAASSIARLRRLALVHGRLGAAVLDELADQPAEAGERRAAGPRRARAARRSRNSHRARRSPAQRDRERRVQARPRRRRGAREVRVGGDVGDPGRLARAPAPGRAGPSPGASASAARGRGEALERRAARRPGRDAVQRTAPACGSQTPP